MILIKSFFCLDLFADLFLEKGPFFFRLAAKKPRISFFSQHFVKFNYLIFLAIIELTLVF